MRRLRNAIQAGIPIAGAVIIFMALIFISDANPDYIAELAGKTDEELAAEEAAAEEGAEAHGDPDPQPREKAP